MRYPSSEEGEDTIASVNDTTTDDRHTTRLFFQDVSGVAAGLTLGARSIELFTR
jgi:hypothetical protein